MQGYVDNSVSGQCWAKGGPQKCLHLHVLLQQFYLLPMGFALHLPAQTDIPEAGALSHFKGDAKESPLPA